MEHKTPKVLIINRGAWDDSKGPSSTVCNLFQNYDAEKLACIYIESKKPVAKHCRYFFQISEYSLIKRLYKWKTQTGFYIDAFSEKFICASDDVLEQEEKTMNYVRGHRSSIFTYLRDFLWLFNGWKSNDLKLFLQDFNPDVIWIFGSPLILMNRLSSFVQKETNKPSAIFLMDDAYTYVDADNGPIKHLYKYFLRKSVKRVVDGCNEVFVISPKMKEEYDKCFNINSTFLTKGIDYSNLHYTPLEVHHPIKLVYMGQVIYGRIFSLIDLAEAIRDINIGGVKIQLYIYTNNQLTNEQREALSVKDSVFLMEPVPFSKVTSTISNYDVVVFVESFEKKYKDVARLSFSTKITDYLGSGKCIFAIGPKNIAPIEYLINEDAAIVATSKEEIKVKLKDVCNDLIIKEYAKKAFDCGMKNHSKEKIDNLVYECFQNLSQQKN